ncbi:MAG: DUF4442 domain-containing protein [Chitinophagaceae bacterium]|nr:MAG: DUF4442 domain-containing protein [Chitinophagaceae bacterium]
MDKRVKRYKRLIRLINFYPPYIGAGIRLKEINDDCTRLVVQMKLRWWNKNMVGTHFGGSLYSMCDPFFMFILMVNLGENYIVWDKTGYIDFKKPGKGKVTAVFSMSQDEISAVKKRVEADGKTIVELPCKITDEQGETVAELNKGIYVRLKEMSKK